MPSVDTFNWDDFKIGFWHPFGPHGGETRDEILSRKAAEVAQNSFTLWSFKNLPSNTLNYWITILQEANAAKIYVLCSDSKPHHTTEPISSVAYAAEYLADGNGDWQQIPSEIKVPHHFQASGNATAFKVRRVVPLRGLHRQSGLFVKRLALKDRRWRSDLGGKLEGQLRLPTRSECLVRRGGETPLPSVYAALELDYPYVVTLRK